MSHLDTAYKIGAAIAKQEWDEYLKQAQTAGGTPVPGPQPAPAPAPAAPPRQPGTAVPPPAAPGVVNPDWRAGLKNRGY